MRVLPTLVMAGLAGTTIWLSPTTAMGATAQGERNGRAQDHVAQSAEDELAVGQRLAAVHDVKLHQAVIAKGSKVSVFGVSRRNGRITSVDVQLADGHIVPRVDLATIRTSFRLADD